MPPSITLEPFSRDLAPELFQLWSDFDTVKFTNWPFTPERAACDARVERMVARYGSDARHIGPFAIRSVEDGRFLGLAGADACEPEGEFDVWYILRREEWGKGIGSAALGEVLAVMRASGKARVATATAVTVNPRSWKLLEKHGFVRRETIAGGHQKHGLSLDLYRYELPLNTPSPEGH